MVFKRREKPSLLARLREVVAPRRGFRRGFAYLGHRVRRLPDTPERIALGFSCGVFITFTPLFGLHILLAIGIARIIGANMLAATIGTVLGNPATFPVIAPLSLGVGRMIIGHGETGRNFTRLADAFGQFFEGLWDNLLVVFGAGDPNWHKLTPFLVDVFLPYLVGGILPGFAAAMASYYITRPVIAAYQARRRSRVRKLARDRIARNRITGATKRRGLTRPQGTPGAPGYGQHP